MLLKRPKNFFNSMADKLMVDPNWVVQSGLRYLYATKLQITMVKAGSFRRTKI